MKGVCQQLVLWQLYLPHYYKNAERGGITTDVVAACLLPDLLWRPQQQVPCLACPQALLLWEPWW